MSAMLDRLMMMGASAGGLHALTAVLSRIPTGFSTPIILIQHRAAETEDTLSGLLAQHSHIPVIEAEEKQPIKPGTVYLAPARYHLLIEREHCFSLSTEPSKHHAIPSIDAAFESAADAYRQGLIAGILSGANADGSTGLACVDQWGGITFVQDPQEAEFSTMPTAAIQAVPHTSVLGIDQIAAFLIQHEHTS